MHEDHYWIQYMRKEKNGFVLLYFTSIYYRYTEPFRGSSSYEFIQRTSQQVLAITLGQGCWWRESSAVQTASSMLSLCWNISYRTVLSKVCGVLLVCKTC